MTDPFLYDDNWSLRAIAARCRADDDQWQLAAELMDYMPLDARASFINRLAAIADDPDCEWLYEHLITRYSAA